ncbi:MAG: hypothetical protein IT426_18945 [Pirellulales bacterium]|nr:hypothetical protein [Pirellulales bacterium]
MNELENEPQPPDFSKRVRAFFAGAAVSCILVYGVLVFISFLLPERIVDLTLGNLVWGPVCPSLFFGFAGGIVGSIVADLPQPKHAALASGFLYGVVLGILFPILLMSAFPNSRQLLYFASACASLGAVVGGAVAIANRDRIDSGGIGRWPRFTLGEMLVGFFFMAVVFACLTAMVRNPH